MSASDKDGSFKDHQTRLRPSKASSRSSSTSTSSITRTSSKDKTSKRANGRKEKSLMDSQIVDETEEIISRHVVTEDSHDGLREVIDDKTKFEVHEEVDTSRFLSKADQAQLLEGQLYTEYTNADMIPTHLFGDRKPVIVNKPSLQNIVYQQQIRIRYLQPPTPPPPGPIIIKEKRAPMPPPLPPLIIRQTVKQPATPPPLIVRERPPTPPQMLKPVVIEKKLPAPPPPPRQVIIERINPPRKPRTIVFEKWLPYKKPKRPIILQRAAPVTTKQPGPNMVIEYSRPTTVSLPEYRVEGIFKVDPLTHTYSKVDGQLKIVDKIYDLPPPNVHIVRASENFVETDQTYYSSIYDMSETTNVANFSINSASTSPY